MRNQKMIKRAASGESWGEGRPPMPFSENPQSCPDFGKKIRAVD